ASGSGSLANRRLGRLNPAVSQPRARAVAILPAPKKPMRGTSLSGISRRLLSRSQPRRSISEKIHCTDFQAAAKCPLLVPKRELGNEQERFLSGVEMLAHPTEN